MKNILSLKLLALLSCILISACTHPISHLPLKAPVQVGRQSHSLTAVIPPAARTFVYKHSNLSGDTWVLNVGAALGDLLPQIFRSQYKSVMVTDAVPSDFQPSLENQLVVINIKEFKADIGWTIFSKHDGILTLATDIRGAKNSSQEVTANGSDSSGAYLKSYAGLILPTAGISGYNEAMGEMITKTVVSAGFKVLEELVKAEQVNKVEGTKPSKIKAQKKSSH